MDGRLKVLFVTHTAKLGGAELALLRLVPHLRSEVHVLLLEDGPLRPRLAAAGAIVHLLPTSRKLLATSRSEVATNRQILGLIESATRTTLGVYQLIRQIKPDLVQGNSLKACVLAAPAARLARKRFVWHVRDFVAPPYMRAGPARGVRLWAAVWASAVVANSAATLAAFRPAGTGEFLAFVVYDGVEAVEALAEMDTGLFTVVMVGRLAPWKGQDVAIRAFSVAFADDPGVRLRLVGGDLFNEADYVLSLRALVEEMGLATRVVFDGHVDNPEKILYWASCAVHASISPEPFGQVVVEAMALGIPTIAARAGGPLEIIEDGLSGLLYTPGSVVELASLLRRLRDDSNLRGLLRANGPHRAERFSIERAALNMTGVFEVLITPHTSAPRQ